MASASDIKIHVRRAMISDVPLLVKLNRELFEFELPSDPTLNESWPDTHGATYFKERVADQKNAAFIAEADGIAVGYLAGGLIEPIFYRHPIKLAELGDMFVVEKCRNTGVGGSLVEAFSLWCREQGVVRIQVEASACNRSALEFYRRLGFVDSTISLEMPLKG